MDKSQINYTEWKKPEKKIVYTVWFYLYKVIDNKTNL